jgi:4-amino-4-deoxy-L-arabinose transferase-like glycosyltransferase
MGHEVGSPPRVRTNRKTALTILLLVIPVLVLYASRLAYSPIYLHHDEVFFALEAHSIASTGRDLYGRFLPLYFQISDDVWFQPILVYVTAFFLKLFPLSESTLRLPSAVMGTIDVVLMYLVARRIFKRERPALLAAVLLALTPAHFIHSRLAMDYIYPVPFVMAWLLCLLIFFERRQMWIVFVATSFLGLGFYTYIASVAMMPVYLLMTWLALFRTDDRPMRLYLAAAAGFVWPLLLLIPWTLHHANALLATAGRYQLSNLPALAVTGVTSTGLPPDADSIASLTGILRDLRQSTHFSGLTGRISLYWYFFDPSYLFLTGGYANVVNSTRRVGVFLLPMAVLLPFGLNQLITRRTRADLIVLLGLVTAPLAACLVVPEPFAIDRELQLLPFAALIGATGAARLWSARDRRWRALAVCLLLLVPLHFGLFYVDYFTDYRARSAFWFEGNRRGALEAIIARAPQERPPSIYLSTDIPYIDWSWKLYAIKYRREDLLARSVYFRSEGFDVRDVPARSLILMPHDTRADALARSGELRLVALIPEPNEPPVFSVLER